MGQTINGVTLIATKLASSGNFQLLFQNAVGGIIFMFSVPSADMATIAALGSGASVNKTYAEDLNKTDYPSHYNHGEGN